jgi:hypothetical protein
MIELDEKFGDKGGRGTAGAPPVSLANLSKYPVGEVAAAAQVGG